MASDEGEKDRHLPIANIGKLMKSVLPENGKMTKEAKESVQDCVSEFICFVTNYAAEMCSRDKRKTVTGSDILQALKFLGFQEYASIVEVYQERWKMDMEACNKNKKRRSAST